MNELLRQTYLSALGIENYMPRWILPAAPEPIPCILPSLDIQHGPAATPTSVVEPLISSPVTTISTKFDSLAAIGMLGDLDVQQKPAVPVNAASILLQFEEKNAQVVSPFSLSVWRPVPGFLIIDSRNTSMALPTEVLLSNILRVVLGPLKPDLNEEVMRWPMIENRFVSRTESDARNELQTWLAVENELRPIKHLWLLGENAIQYFIDEHLSVIESRWQSVTVGGPSGMSSLSALLLPSLNELLHKPTDKALLWAVLN